MTPTTPLDIIQGIQQDIAGLDLADRMARQCCIMLVNSLECKISRYDQVQDALEALYGHEPQFADETPEEKEALDAVEARKTSNSHVNAVFAPILAGFLGRK